MTNDELILAWDKLYMKREDDLSMEEIKEFGKLVSESRRNNFITAKEAVKFAALVCYLGN